ncbi:S-adenosyl-L-methionine-dependent methyltransferase [Hesseltinella vesiculosa]|uniref:S-adenosyl-L-methionine-dependent methyltransferase n=1 Tax=Hesseltinella vesiculosa TaxID=101127 RepID=A0A1X2GIB8_9FUNG|nr:S-adenosyl-L-methionine-dependent methyltransferase [Hesseltinella vesiculosa]
MGNQASRIIEKNKDRKIRKAQLHAQRRSTLNAESRSLSSHISNGNYDWIDENELTTLSVGALAAAMEKARPQTNENYFEQKPVPERPAQPPRRKSITEYFTKRRPSMLQQRPPAALSDFDYKEFDRWQREHYLLKSARKANAWASINTDTGSVVIDAGTGTGIWALEMATQYPRIQVLGLDRLLPQEQQRLDNLRFAECDVTQSWPMSDHAVDFVHQRHMKGSIKENEWLALLTEMYRVLKPGGYVELVEEDFWDHNAGPMQQAFGKFVEEQCQENGIDYNITEALASLLTDAGFTDLEKKTLDIPLGEWPSDPELKQFGFINQEAHRARLRNHRDFIVKTWGISSDECDALSQEVMDEFEEYHGFTRIHTFIAKKPL